MSIIKFNPNVAVRNPLGVKPRGNLFASEIVQAELAFRSQSLGLFAQLDESLVVDIFEFFNDTDLLKTEIVSKYFLAFSRHNELWRTLFWNDEQENVVFDTDWRTSYLRSRMTTKTAKKCRMTLDDSSGMLEGICSRVFSDLLYAPYRMSGLCPSRDWLSRENIDRIEYTDLTREKFVTLFEEPNRPVIITGFVKTVWGGLVDDVIASIGNEPVSCGSVSMRIPEFFSYIESGINKTDENQYFVFDTKTFSKSPRLPVIPFFGTDLFDLLSPPWRPDNAWLLIGAAGAASKWHVDPNSTSAWNAVVRGEKKWILLPPHLGPPPGVEASTDGFAVRQPVTLMEWLTSGYYEEMYDKYSGKGLVECTCREGEIVFVPRGWWHCVINTGETTTVAVTQNYAAESQVDKVRVFLKKYKHCVSGIPHEFRSRLWIEFDRVLRAFRPDLIKDEELDCQEPIEEEASKPYPDSCESGDEECGDFSFWGNLGSRTIEFSRDH